MNLILFVGLGLLCLGLLAWSMIIFIQNIQVRKDLSVTRAEIKEFEAELIKLASLRKYRRF